MFPKGQMTMRKLQSTGLVLAALLALGACGEKSAPPAAPVAAPAGTQLKLALTTIADMKAVGAEVTTRDQAEARVRIPGTLASLDVRAGDTVTKGQPVIVLEAMKMEHALVAPFDGVVGTINAAIGDQVGADTVLAVIEGESA